MTTWWSILIIDDGSCRTVSEDLAYNISTRYFFVVNTICWFFSIIIVPSLAAVILLFTLLWKDEQKSLYQVSQCLIYLLIVKFQSRLPSDNRN